MARPNLMQSQDTFKDAVEALLEEWDGEGAEEDVLERALDMSADAEHGKRLRHHRMRMRGDKDPEYKAPVPEGMGEESSEYAEGEVCPECGKADCECLPDMED